jgi:type IV pilus assembly protein PilC
MVEAGEVTGQLEDVFSRMSDTYEKENKLRTKIKGSLSYPASMVVVAILVVIVLMVKVVPSFVDILYTFKVEMPKITLFLISVSNFVQKTWFILIFLVIGSIFGIKGAMKSQNGKQVFHGLLLKMPLIGKIMVKIITARFSRTMSILLSSGVHLIQCMEVVQKIVGNVIIENKLDVVIDEVKKGKGLYGPLSNMNFFPPMVMSMVRIGEESGELDFALDKCADYYDQEVEAGLQTLTSLIEPIVMVTMSVVVGFIVLSILFPMFSIYENLSK